MFVEPLANSHRLTYAAQVQPPLFFAGIQVPPRNSQ
jgi:hypothetical protein